MANWLHCTIYVDVFALFPNEPSIYSVLDKANNILKEYISYTHRINSIRLLRQNVINREKETEKRLKMNSTYTYSSFMAME